MSGWLSRLTRTHEETEAQELGTKIEDVGADPIAECTRGQKARVCGTIRSLALRPQSASPALEAELFDGSGHLRLIWLGRRRIPGIEVGQTIVVEGRMTCPDGDLTMYNPMYLLQPTGTS